MSLEIRRHHWRSISRRLAVPAGLTAVLGIALPAAAQPSSDQPTAGWQNGFFIQSTDGQNRLQIGLLTQFDGYFAVDDKADALTDSFSVRRLRPTFRGTLGNRFSYRFTPELAGGSLAVLEAYIETRFSSAFRLRVGKTKSPVGLERQHSAASLLFVERALPTGVAPNRDVGIQVLGDLAAGRVSYVAGILNGSRDGSSSDTDTGDGKDLVARITVEPVDGLSLALAGSTGDQDGTSALPSYRTATGRQPFFSYDAVAANGRRTRLSPSASYYRGPLGAFTEYVRSDLAVERASARTDISHEAWQIAGSWVLTGEDATAAGVVPRTDFGFGDGWGAVQVAARYHGLTVDRTAFDLGFAASNANRKAAGWTAGLNWYLNRHLLYQLNVERTVFDDDDGWRPAENVIAFRSQLNF